MKPSKSRLQLSDSESDNNQPGYGPNNNHSNARQWQQYHYDIGDKRMRTTTLHLNGLQRTRHTLQDNIYHEQELTRGDKGFATYQDCRRWGGGTLREVQAGIEHLTDGMNRLLQDQHELRSFRREMQAAQNDSTALKEELVTAHSQIWHLRRENEMLQQKGEEDRQTAMNRLAKLQRENE